MSTTLAPDSQRVIRASEIGEYVYCHRAWWLHHIQGIESANRLEMQAGVLRHRAHGQAVQRAGQLQTAAFAFAALAVILALLSVVFG